MKCTIICGSRQTSRDQDVLIWDYLTKHPPEFIAHGDAKGVDATADRWARRVSIPRLQVSADWTIGGAGGPIRNHKLRNLCLLLFGVDNVVCLAFPGGTGTASMVKLCQEKHIWINFAHYEKGRGKHDG